MAPRAVAGPPDSSAAAHAARPWSGSVKTYLYLQDGDDLLLPILRADRGALHLEGRFQYEDRRTASAWLGWTLEMGKSLHLKVVPMAGAIVGRTNGVAPGFELTLSWKSLDLYSEGEYILDFEHPEGDYFYNWSELSWQARPWLRLGFAAQRAQTYRGELAIEPGAFAAARRGRVEASVYGFNLGGRAPFVIVALGLDF